MLGQWLMPAVISGVVSFAVALGITEYRLRREQSVENEAEINEWYSDAASIASDVHNLWQSDYERVISDERKGKVKRSEIQRAVKLRSKQINSHIADSSSLDVDDEIVNEMEDLKDKCSALAQATTAMGANMEFKDRGREMVDKAKSVEEAALKKI